MFGFGGKKNKTKVVVKTAKGGGPIRKVKFAIGAGVLASLLAPFVEPFLLRHLGYVPDGFTTDAAQWLIENYEFLASCIAAYMARPDAGDGVIVEGA